LRHFERLSEEILQSLKVKKLRRTRFLPLTLAAKDSYSRDVFPLFFPAPLHQASCSLDGIIAQRPGLA